MLTAPMKPKETEGNRRAARLSAKLFVHVKDPAWSGRHLSIDQDFMDQWAESAGVEMTTDTGEV